MEELNKFESYWGLSIDNPHKIDNINDIYKLSLNVINVNEATPDQVIFEKYNDYIKNLIELTNNIKKDIKSDIQVEIRVNRLLQISYYAQKFHQSLRFMKQAMDLNTDYRDANDASLFRFNPIDVESNTSYQNFLLFVLEHFYENKYARYLEDVYAPLYTKDGYNTCAWKRIDTIQDVLYKLVQKETNYHQFLNVTKSGNTINAASDFLSKCCDSQFPQIIKNRHIFSFNNGIYIANEDKFVDYSSELNEHSSKYFDTNFEYKENWKEIKTPYLDSILKYQELDEETIKWVYIFIGRLIYNIDEKDGWQVIPFLQGQAGCGKSTILLNICKYMYDEEDVGVLSNNIQTTFGLSDIVDKLLFIAPEIKRDFKMEQGEFQSIVSGDKVTINIKFKKSRFENWDIPGILAGNEIPDFIDNSGSIQRRIVIIKFTKRVKESDLLLGRKLQQEIPNILQKCNKVYLEYAEKYGRKNVWTVMPKYFEKTQKELAATTNPLIHLLTCGKLEFSPDKYIPEKNFMYLFNDHCNDTNYKKIRFNKDFYTGPFSQFGIEVEKSKRKYNGRTMETTFFIGIDIKEEN